MAGRFDSASKAIIDTNPIAWLKFVGIDDVDAVDILDSDLTTQLTLDRLLKPYKNGVTTELQHYELMTYFNEPDLVRFGSYNFLAAYKYSMPVRTTLVLLKKMSGYEKLTGELVYGDQTFHYRVIKLWETPPQEILIAPEVLPLLPLTNVTLDNLPSYMEKAKSIAGETPPDIEKDIWLAMRTFSGLLYNSEQTSGYMEGILNMVDLRESLTYQDILREGMAEGMAKGMAKGMAEGKAEGKEELLNLQLSRRFSTLPASITDRLDRLSSSQFDSLALALLDFKNLEDLESWLADQNV